MGGLSWKGVYGLSEEGGTLREIEVPSMGRWLLVGKVGLVGLTWHMSARMFLRSGGG